MQYIPANHKVLRRICQNSSSCGRADCCFHVFCGFCEYYTFQYSTPKTWNFKHEKLKALVTLNLKELTCPQSGYRRKAKEAT